MSDIVEIITGEKEFDLLHQHLRKNNIVLKKESYEKIKENIINISSQSGFPVQNIQEAFIYLVKEASISEREKIMPALDKLCNDLTGREMEKLVSAFLLLAKNRNMAK